MTVGNHGQTFKFSYDVFGSGAGTNFNNITGSTLLPRNYSSFIFMILLLLLLVLLLQFQDEDK